MFSRRITLAVVCTATAMLMLDIAVVNTALPHIARDLHAGLTGVQWVVDAYTLALAAVVLTAGSLNDRFGRRRSLVAGLVLFNGSSVVCALAGSIGVLDTARAAQGLGAAAMFASTLAVLADAFPTGQERARAFAAFGATIGAAFAVGPLVGGALTSALDWRAIFFVNVPLGAACLVGTMRGVRESRDPHPRRVDVPGQVLLTVGLLGLVLGLLRGNVDGWTSVRSLIELVSAAVLLIGFLAVQYARREPMMPLGLFRNRSFAGAQIAAFAISGSFFAVFLYTTLYLQIVRHLSPIGAGLVYLPATGLCFVMSGMYGQLCRRLSNRALISGGLALVAIGLAIANLAGAHSSWVALMPGMLLAAGGTGLFNPALSAVALGEVPQHQSGLAAGVNDSFRNVGIAVGVAALGALIPTGSVLSGGGAANFVSGLHHALFGAAALAACGAVASAALIRSKPPVDAEDIAALAA